MKRTFFVAAAALAVAAAGWADAGPRAAQYALHQDTSGPLRDVIHKYTLKLPTGLNREIPNRLAPPYLDLKERPPLDWRDPLLDRGATLVPSQTPVPSLVFDGVNDVDGVVPPDTDGDVGPNHYLQWINLSFQIYDKAGNALTPITDGNAFWDGFGGSCETGNDGDPLVLYDHYADRWMVTQFDVGLGLACTAVSTTPDPLGSYHRYAFDVGNFNDYPKAGLWSDSYGYTFNEFGDGNVHAVACALERNEMLVGGAARFVCREFECTGTECPFGVLPADLEGPQRPADGAPIPLFMYWDSAVDGSVGPDGVRIWNLNVDWADPDATTLTLADHVEGEDFNRALCFFSRNCIPQPAPGERLDSLTAMTMWRAHYRVEDGFDSVLLNATADLGLSRGGIRWAELHNALDTWSFFQEGTHGPDDGLHRWMGSIAKDAAGNICLGYSVSSAEVFPSVRYACREPGDPLGTLAEEQEMKAGTGAQIGSANRWGDYSSLTLDATDDCSFWFTQEYYQTTGAFAFNTSIGTWKYPDCEGGCELAGRVLNDRVQRGLPVPAGTVLPVDLRLRHNRRQAADATFILTLRDGDGNVIGQRQSPRRHFEFGDRVQHRDRFRLPLDLVQGRYELSVSVHKMAQGRVVWQQPILVD